MKIHDHEQQSPEWFAVRSGKISASHAQAIAAQGKGIDTYIIELMAEYYSTAEKESFSNKHTARGIEMEEQARTIYELDRGVDVQKVGFIEHSDFVGCSPDGLVGDDGLVEIKCPDDKAFFKFMLDGKIDTGYEWQMQMQMLITGREWCDYVVYNPNFDKSIIVTRLLADKEKHDKLLQGFALAESMIKEIMGKVENK